MQKREYNTPYDLEGRQIMFKCEYGSKYLWKATSPLLKKYADLQEQKHHAVSIEDYDAAKALKEEIERLRQRSDIAFKARPQPRGPAQRNQRQLPQLARRGDIVPRFCLF